MLCYGGPLDGKDVDRSEAAFEHTQLLSGQMYTYRYQGMFCPPMPLLRPGVWPTNSIRPMLAHIYQGETIEQASAPVS